MQMLGEHAVGTTAPVQRPQHLELDSGAARTDAHRFYEREGTVWPSKSFAYRLDG